MDWFGAGIDGPLVAVRAIHFAATSVMAGSLLFPVVAAPVVRSDQAASGLLRTQRLQLGWVGLAMTLASAVIWLLLEASSMSGLPLRKATTSQVLLTVLQQTQFGWICEIRLALVLVLALCLTLDRLAPFRWAGLVAALALTAAIAWTGHAASTMGKLGLLHLSADVLHLVAGAAWIGGLVALVRLLAETRRELAHGPFARNAIRRFSMLGILSVGTLLLSGIVNTWMLAGSFRAMAVTDYGRLLLLKITLFAIMVAIAAINRLWLTPKPKLEADAQRQPQFGIPVQLERNSLIEIFLGFIIFALVGLLGTLHPAIPFL
jgi:putative copper resistance protein D